MSRRDVIFRADACRSIGYGHFIRSLALAGYLKDDFDCVFYSFNLSEKHPTEYQLSEIEKVCQYRHIEADTLEQYNRRFVDALDGHEIVVLDNYYFQTDYQKQIRDKGCRLVCVDDLHDRHMVADAVLTCCPLEASSFSLESYTRFFGGLSHSFLRDEFLSVDTTAILRNSIPEKIAVAMGGADPFGLTNKIVNIIRDIDRHMEIAVIAGDAVDTDALNDANLKIYRRLSAKEIVAIFKWADLGIFPASTICIEALACHLPVAAGWYVDNQKEFYQYGVSEKLFTPLGNLLDVQADDLHRKIKQVITSRITPSPTIDFQSGKRDIIELFKEL